MLVRIIEIGILSRINLFALQRLEEVLQLALSYGFAGRLMLGSIPWRVRIATYSANAYCTPRSEWCTSPGKGPRVSIACSNASVASRAASVQSSLQPTTLREKPSGITARYTNSARNRMYVMSATQS